MSIRELKESVSCIIKIKEFLNKNRDIELYAMHFINLINEMIDEAKARCINITDNNVYYSGLGEFKTGKYKMLGYRNIRGSYNRSIDIFLYKNGVTFYVSVFINNEPKYDEEDEDDYDD